MKAYLSLFILLCVFLFISSDEDYYQDYEGNPYNINIESISYELTYNNYSVVKVIVKTYDQIDMDFSFIAYLRAIEKQKDYKLNCSTTFYDTIECYTFPNVKFNLEDKYTFYYDKGKYKYTFDENEAVEDTKTISLIFKPEINVDERLYKDHKRITAITDGKMVGGGYLYITRKDKSVLNKRKDGFNKYIELNNFIPKVGFHYDIPLSTLIGYKKAIKRGYHIVDAVLRFTKDKVPVISHEEDLEKISNGEGKIYEYSYNDDKLISRIQKKKNKENDEYTIREKEDYSYDSNNNLVEKIKSSYDSDTSTYIIESKEEYTYNSSNLKTTTVNNSGQVSSMNNFGVSGNTQNLEKETTTTTIYTQQVGYPKQTQYTKKDINDAQSQIQKNITKTETTITSINTNNLMGQNRGINSKTNINTNALNSMNIIKTLKTNKNVNSNATNTINSNISSNNINSNVNNLNKNYSQGYGVTKFEKTTIVNKQNTQQSGEQQTGMFQEKLVDVLNNEITKNELEYQEKMKNRDINIETHTPYLYEQNHIMIQGQNLFQTFEYAPSMFLFMYPIFKTNKIVGAIEDESTGKVQVNFKQAFEDKDIQLNEFPQGGAFCNYDKNLYFTGGQETQKGVGKLFLGVSISEKDLTARLVKFPSMIFSHWNHSMISNGKYVFSIGGYNSNKCEYFNLKAFKWVALPDLNSEERQRPMLFIYKDYLYAFMGYTQFSILDSVERININKLSTSKWEKVSISNPENINLKFYGAGTYFLDGILYFVGGKIGQGNDDSDYKDEIYSFDFYKMEFLATSIGFSGQLDFIESQFHHCNEETIGNFIEVNDGCLATISVSSLYNKEE